MPGLVKRLRAGLTRSRRLFDALWVALAVAVFSVAMTGATAAQPAGDERAQLTARKDALFQQMLKNPGNLDIIFAYAEAAAKLGDNEAAVSALERMLLFNPKLTRVDLELGALYFRMGSYEVSRLYFEKALKAKPPPTVKANIDRYLDEIARRTARQHLAGFLFFGVQYQSDANLGPGSPVIQSPIGTVLLNNEFVKRADIDGFATGSVLYSYDLGTQSDDTFEVGAIGFANHYGRVTRLDLGFVEATAGPRFRFRDPLPWVADATLKPYLIANDVGLGGNQYFHTFGAGGEATATVWGDLGIKSLFELRDRNFNDAPDRPLSRGLNGTDKLFSLFLVKPITAAPQSALNLEFDFLDRDARLGFYSNKTFALSGAYRIRYRDPTGTLRLPLVTTFLLSYARADYASPDPCCNTSTIPGVFLPAARADRLWRFGVTQSFEVSDNVAVVLQLQRDIVSSNLPLYAYTSNSVVIGPHIRF